MTISEKTRESRIATWKAKKSVWEAKLAAARDAADDNGIAVAKLMFDEAEDALKRLGVSSKVEVGIEVHNSTKTNSKSELKKIKNVKATTDILKAKGSTDTTSTIGL